MSVCLQQLFSAPRRPTLVSEVPIEGPLLTEGLDYVTKAISQTGVSTDVKIGIAQYVYYKQINEKSSLECGEDVLTSSCHIEMNAELSIHSHDFSLSKHAHHSYIKIAFLPDWNSSVH